MISSNSCPKSLTGPKKKRRTGLQLEKPLSERFEASKDWQWGYHFTAARNLPSIEESGLIPYNVHKEHLDIHRPGIWVWKDPAEGEDLCGVILQRLIDHHAWEIAMLRVKYREWDAYPFGSSLFTIRHSGTMTGSLGQTWSYHEDRISYVIETPIPPNHIEVLCKFDIMKFIEEQVRYGSHSSPTGSRRDGVVPLLPLTAVVEKKEAQRTPSDVGSH